jgi:hypothetical protein
MNQISILKLIKRLLQVSKSQQQYPDIQEIPTTSSNKRSLCFNINNCMQTLLKEKHNQNYKIINGISNTPPPQFIMVLNKTNDGFRDESFVRN